MRRTILNGRSTCFPRFFHKRRVFLKIILPPGTIFKGLSISFPALKHLSAWNFSPLFTGSQSTKAPQQPTRRSVKLIDGTTASACFRKSISGSPGTSLSAKDGSNTCRRYDHYQPLLIAPPRKSGLRLTLVKNSKPPFHFFAKNCST